MSYQTTVNAIRSAAQAVNPAGTFRHGRKIDASQGSVADTFPCIHLYPFTMPKPTNGDFVGNNSMIVGFWEQDTPETNPEQREAIINRMDELCDLFLEQLGAIKTIRVSNAVAEPQYQMFMGTVSGVAVRFNLEVINPNSPC